MAEWLNQTVEVKAFSLFELGLIDATDEIIFEIAQMRNVVILTKDEDMADLVLDRGFSTSNNLDHDRKYY